MKTYATVAEADGAVLSVVTIADIETLVLNTPPGAHAVPCDDPNIIPGKWQFTGGTFSARPLPARPLSEQKDERWAAVRDARDRAEAGGCETPLGRVDTDADSQRKVSGSVQLAMIARGSGEPFVIDWTMQDNSTETHDAAAMIAMGVAVGRHVAACHAEGLRRRTLIDEATSEAEVVAVPIEGGWPGEASA